MTRAADSLVVCERCDRVHRWTLLAPGQVARCTRCGSSLGRGHRLSLQSLLALTLAAAILYAVALTTDVISIHLRGTTVSASLPGTVAAAWSDGQRLVAVLTAITAVIAPGLFIAIRLYVLLPLTLGRMPAGFSLCLRMLRHASEWNMVEVLTIGALLSLVRLVALAEAAPGPALFALGALTLLLAAIESAGLRHLWWHSP